MKDRRSRKNPLAIALMLLSPAIVAAVSAEDQEFDGGYRFTYYAVTHEGAEDELGGSGVIYISPEPFGFGTNPELKESPLVNDLIEDRLNEHLLNRDKADVCMANLPVRDSTAAIALMRHQLVLSRAQKREDRMQFDYIRGVDSAFDWVLHFDGKSITGTGWNHEAWFGFASDRMKLTPAPEIGLAECVAFAEQNVNAFSAIRDTSSPLWEKHSARTDAREFWKMYEERSSSGMEIALNQIEWRIERYPHEGKAWAMKALIYGNAVDFMAMPPEAAKTAAGSALDKALENAPHAPETQAAYGLLKRREDPEGAETRLRRCIAAAPAFAECHNLYGDLLRKTGRAEQAGDIYLEGLERWPENGELHVSYALYLQETGRASEAIEYLREFVAISRASRAGTGILL